MAGMNNTVTATGTKGLVPLSPFLGSQNLNTQTGSSPIRSPQQGLVLGGSASAGTLGIGSQPASSPSVTGFTDPNGGITPTFASGANNGTAPATTQNQQNLAKYGLTSMPAGYQFSANGQLLNNAGQEYTAPASGNTQSTGTPPLVSSNYSPSTNPASSQNQNPYTSSAPTFPGLVGSLASTASQPSADYTAAQTAAAQEKQQLATLQGQAAQAQGSVNNTPGISLQGATGESGQIQNTLAGMEAPIATELTASQAQAAAATAQQGTQQSGLNAAGTLAAPQPGQNPATQSYNPLTNTYSPLAANSAGTAGTSAQAALVHVGQLQGAQAAGAALIPLQQALDAGNGAAANITSYLAANPSLNSSSLNLGNLASQWAAGQYSGANSAQYQTLGNYLTTFATQMAPLLAPGGTVTDASRLLQQSLVNGSANNQTISQVLAQLTAEAQSTYNNRASGAAGGGTVSGGSSVTSVPGGTNPPSALSGSIFSGYQ